METIINYLLISHATAGGFSLISGLFAIFSKKGGTLHKKSGKVYFWGMVIVVVTGLIIGAYKGNLFIQTIAVFSFYMVFTGRRVLRFKQSITPSAVDWLFNVISMLTATAMVSYAAFLLYKIGFRGITPMLLVFGSLLLTMVIQDYKKLRKKQFVKNAWLFDHISRMGGSYIATVTAFLVINIDFQPAWIVWLLPTAVGTPIMIKTSAAWRKKLDMNKQQSQK